MERFTLGRWAPLMIKVCAHESWRSSSPSRSRIYIKESRVTYPFPAVCSVKKQSKKGKKELGFCSLNSPPPPSSSSAAVCFLESHMERVRKAAHAGSWYSDNRKSYQLFLFLHTQSHLFPQILAISLEVLFFAFESFSYFPFVN